MALRPRPVSHRGTPTLEIETPDGPEHQQSSQERIDVVLRRKVVPGPRGLGRTNANAQDPIRSSGGKRILIGRIVADVDRGGAAEEPQGALQRLSLVRTVAWQQVHCLDS